MSIGTKAGKNDIYLEIYKVPKTFWDWTDCILQWIFINIFISSIPIFISAFLPYVVPQLKPKPDEIIVAVSVTAISVALTNSQFPDEIKELHRRAQKFKFYNVHNNSLHNYYYRFLFKRCLAKY
jgi:hypothetical protein